MKNRSTTAKPTETKVRISKSWSLNEILIEFSKNKFEPEKNLKNEIPYTSGNCIICLNKESKLPKLEFKVEFKTLDGLSVLYTGIAGRSLRKRNYHQHFNGNAGSSTLRKSLGVLFGYKLIKDSESGKTKFDPKEDHEKELSKWMKKNLVMYFSQSDDLENKLLENKLIEELNPPLNLKKNKNSINKSFREKLLELRNNI